MIAAHAPEPARFRRVLAAIRRAADGAGQTEIILVRNGGPEIAADLLAAAQPLKLVEEERLGIAFARAAGISASHGEMICFIDDDTVAAADYLIEARSFAKTAPEVGVFGGLIEGEFARPPDPALKPVLAFLALRNLGAEEKRVAPGAEPGFDVPGAGMVLRREVALAFRDMVEEGRLAGIGRAGASLASGDDTVCCRLARRMGFSLAYTPRLRLTHIIPKTRIDPAYLSRLVRGIGASAARVDALFGGPVRILSMPQLWARVAVHVLRNGFVAGRITSGWHAGYREQALRERAGKAKVRTA